MLQRTHTSLMLRAICKVSAWCVLVVALGPLGQVCADPLNSNAEANVKPATAGQPVETASQNSGTQADSAAQAKLWLDRLGMPTGILQVFVGLSVGVPGAAIELSPSMVICGSKAHTKTHRTCAVSLSTLLPYWSIYPSQSPVIFKERRELLTKKGLRQFWQTVTEDQGTHHGLNFFGLKNFTNHGLHRTEGFGLDWPQFLGVRLGRGEDRGVMSVRVDLRLIAAAMLAFTPSYAFIPLLAFSPSAHVGVQFSSERLFTPDNSYSWLWSWVRTGTIKSKAYHDKIVDTAKACAGKTRDVAQERWATCQTYAKRKVEAVRTSFRRMPFGNAMLATQ